ncbi:aminopeptidase [Thermococcus argininiproducens]|uniref:Aminopeptidase n=1 Tax=Thermococcus argininiproducens TaxID=2866384 RepID=A0A9E7SDR8_9EURY|nr:M1 family aminopeptidase [Thermococcus argininiproducens]USH00298.1 aminopeptidase [Thermococcus argininiproducens]
MKARSVVVVLLVAFIVMCISSSYTFDKFQFSKTDNAKLLFERSGEFIGGNSSISLDITFDGWNVTIKGVQEIELSLNSPATIPFLFENSSILNINLEKIEVYGARADVTAFYDDKYGLLLLNITPIENVQRIKIFYTSKYQPLFDINMRDIIEWHMKSTKEHFYLPPEAYMLLSNLKGDFIIKISSYPSNYALAGILKLPNNKYKPFLPEENTFHTDGGRFYVLLGKWKVYEKTTKIGEKSVKITALTDESDPTDELAKILKIYSSYLTPYPYDEFIYIRIKGHRSEIEGFGLYGGAVGTQFENVIPHEVAHNWFGMYAELGLLDESLATYTSSFYNMTPVQLDYWEGICLSSRDRTPVVEINAVTRRHQTNLYHRGGFIFRSLQFVVGNETFFQGLRELLAICHVKECNNTEETLNLIKEIYENLTKQNLEWFFREWFYTADYPNFTVSSLKVAQNDSYYTLMLNITDKNGFAMPLEVEVVTLSENITKRIFVNGSVILRLELKEQPFKIILDPNDWIANINGSSYRVNWEKFTFEKIEKKEREINGVKIIVN